jgi:hypothetical protein
MHWPFLLLALLSTTPAHGLKTQTDQNEDEGSSYLPIVAESGPLDTERFDPMAQVHVNWTRPGRSRGPRRNLPRSLLEARQDVRFSYNFQRHSEQILPAVSAGRYHWPQAAAWQSARTMIENVVLTLSFLTRIAVPV